MVEIDAWRSTREERWCAGAERAERDGRDEKGGGGGGIDDGGWMMLVEGKVAEGSGRGRALGFRSSLISLETIIMKRK